MTEDEWRALVARLEAAAGEHPHAYARKVALLGALGYLVVLAGVAVLAALVAFVIVLLAKESHLLLLRVIWPIGALGLIIIRSLSVRIDPPIGIPLRTEDAPELFRVIGEVDQRIRGPRVHHILVNGDFNAFVAQVPRYLGIFASTNYLVLGLPYMQALGPNEFRSVIAHELGHLSRKHGRFGTWLYRVNAMWTQLLRALERAESWATVPFQRFFEWYAPYFAAYSFPLRRRHEYEADAAAADVAGAEAAANALALAAVGGTYLEREYWPRVYALAEREAEPPPAAFAGLGAAVATARRHGRARDWLRAELNRPAAPHDTHPTLAQRIQRLGLRGEDLVATATADGSSATRETAAQAFLGATENKLAARLDADWHEAIASSWRDRHEEVNKLRVKLDELEKRAETGSLSPEEAAERAYLTAWFQPEQSEALLRELLEGSPDNAAAHFKLGEVLLAQGDESGLDSLERAMELDTDATLSASELAFNFLADKDALRAEEYRGKANEHAGVLQAAQAERRAITTDGPFDPYTLDEKTVDALRTRLAGVGKLRRAYLVRKPMQHLDDEFPLHVLVLQPRGLLRSRQKLIEDVDMRVQFPGWLLCPTDVRLKRLGLDRIPGAKIYEVV